MERNIATIIANGQLMFRSLLRRRTSATFAELSVALTEYGYFRDTAVRYLQEDRIDEALSAIAEAQKKALTVERLTSELIESADG